MNKFGAGAACVVALAFSGAAEAKVINLGTISSVESILGSLHYKPDENVTFKFKVTAPYSFDFMATGSGGTFPFPITIAATGTFGKYTETFGPFPVKGKVNYTLTSMVPEPATWALMIIGIGALGGVARRGNRVLQRA